VTVLRVPALREHTGPRVTDALGHSLAGAHGAPACRGSHLDEGRISLEEGAVTAARLAAKAATAEKPCRQDDQSRGWVEIGVLPGTQGGVVSGDDLGVSGMVGGEPTGMRFRQRTVGQPPV
jgi:hypothetical protein